MDDLISRQAAIDRATKEHDFFCGAVTVSDKARRDELLNVMCWLGELPPAQLGTNLAKVGTDCVSRQAAIKILHEALDAVEQIADVPFGVYQNYRDKMNELPPAQPAPSQVAADIARIVENGKDMRVIEAAQPTSDQNGDLWITVPDIDEVTCVYVQENKSKFCRIFYEEQEQTERIIHCKDCEWWTKQECSPQGRCALSGMYPTGGWFCGNARRREVTA